MKLLQGNKLKKMATNVKEKANKAYIDMKCKKPKPLSSSLKTFNGNSAQDQRYEHYTARETYRANCKKYGRVAEDCSCCSY